MKPKSTSKRPTSKDVAKLAGVSRTTVSYVINERTGSNIRISEETRQRVWEAVKALNYRPSSAAQALRTRRSNLLAVMIPRVENPFFPHFASAIQDEAEKEHLDVIIYSTHNQLARERHFLNVMLQRGVDGLITQTYRLSTDDIARLIEAGIAVVVHGESPTHRLADNIGFDEANAVREVVSYLINQGHQRIATIAGPETTWGGKLRRQGYIDALRAHGIPLEPELICETRFMRGCGAQAMQQLLDLPSPPTAVFAANDLLAIDALLFAVDAGLSLPDDLAIVGFDDIPEATIVRPKLTTVHKDRNQLAATVVQMLLERINSEEVLPARQRMLDYKIVYRDSA
jgi:LacI family repressor for deo operon, udp, cdd, tsx, nupC, and nupG